MQNILFWFSFISNLKSRCLYVIERNDINIIILLLSEPTNLTKPIQTLMLLLLRWMNNFLSAQMSKKEEKKIVLNTNKGF